MGCRCSFCRSGVDWWWWGAIRMSLAAKFWSFWTGWTTDLGAPIRRHLQQPSHERIQEVRSFGCTFHKKSEDWTDVLEVKVSSLTDMVHFFMDSFKSRVNPRFLGARARNALRAERGGVRDRNGSRLYRSRKWKTKSFCFVIVEFEFVSHPCSHASCAYAVFLTGINFVERGQFLKLKSEENNPRWLHTMGTDLHCQPQLLAALLALLGPWCRGRVITMEQVAPH